MRIKAWIERHAITCILIALVLVPVLRIGACVLSMHPLPVGAQQSELQHAGDELLAELENWRNAHGRYPASFDEAGITPEKTAFGRWEYGLDANAQTCQLKLGDYDVDGWVLYWRSDERQWRWDT